LGQGFFGKVYRGTILSTGRPVAIKEISKAKLSPEVKKQMIQEIEICRVLK
jgi:serine/threonine protein kinase